MEKTALEKKLIEYKNKVHPLIPGLTKAKLKYLDFSEESAFLQNLDLKDTFKFNQVLFDEVLRGKVGIGGYFENRIIYRRSTHYDGAEARSLHLGLDLWVAAGTAIYSPLPGTIHSLQDNQGFGNYGPTIIVEHVIEDLHIFGLYGHLSHESLRLWKPGDKVLAGQEIAWVGDFPENGDWPPHLHWQLMKDMLGNEGDFPGVSAPSDRDFYLQICLDPHYLLKLSDT